MNLAKSTFWGYKRENGRVGVRNHVVILPVDDLSNAAAQAVEHYEMTRYGTLVAWAKQLGRADCASVLQQNLDEEKAADAKLSSIAEGNVNAKAAA